MAQDTNIYYKADLAATKQTVKASSTQVSYIQAVNVASNAITYVQFFDALAANVTVGTTAPKFTVAIDAAAASHVTAVNIPLPNPIYFKTGCVVAATTSATGSSAPSGNVLLTVVYS